MRSLRASPRRRPLRAAGSGRSGSLLGRPHPPPRRPIGAGRLRRLVSAGVPRGWLQNVSKMTARRIFSQAGLEKSCSIAAFLDHPSHSETAGTQRHVELTQDSSTPVPVRVIFASAVLYLEHAAGKERSRYARRCFSKGGDTSSPPVSPPFYPPPRHPTLPAPGLAAERKLVRARCPVPRNTQEIKEKA